MDDRSRMIDVLAQLPLPEFLERVKRMASGTYQPGSALNRTQATPAANPRRAAIADAIGRQRQSWLRALIKDGLTTRNIVEVTGMSEAEVERQRRLQTTRAWRRKPVSMVRDF